MRSVSSDLAASTTPITKYLVSIVFLLEIKRLLYYHDRFVGIVIVNTQFSVLGQSPNVIQWELIFWKSLTHYMLIQ